MIVWRGRRPTREEQVANACDSLVDLTPVSPVYAQQIEANWAAWLPGQAIPLIGEDRRYGREDEQDQC